MIKRVAVFTLGISTMLACSADGGIITPSGVLHATATAIANPSPQVTNTASDVNFAPPTTGGTIHAEATNATPSILIIQQASINATVNCLSGISINGSGSVTGGPWPQSDTGAHASGTINFTESTTESLTASTLASNEFFSIGVTVKNSSNVTVYTMNTADGSSSQNVLLTPGAYTLNWDIDAHRFNGNIGGIGSASFSLVPEPVGLCWLAAGLGLCIRNRRRA